MLSQIPWSLFTYFFLLLFRLNFNRPISSSPTLSSACLSVLPILGSKMAHEEAPLSCPSCGSIKNNQVKNKKLHWTNTGALGNSPRFTAHQGDIKSGPPGKEVMGGCKQRHLWTEVSPAALSSCNLPAGLVSRACCSSPPEIQVRQNRDQSFWQTSSGADVASEVCSATCDLREGNGDLVTSPPRPTPSLCQGKYGLRASY